jgi:hypothetical protein
MIEKRITPMRISTLCIALSILVLLLTLIGGTLANDAFVHQSAGNLQFFKNYSVAIRSEHLIIGPPKTVSGYDAEPLIPIHVEYEMENVTQTPIEAAIGFPMPACNMNQYLWNKHLSFISGSASTCVKEPQTELSVDGTPTMSGRMGSPSMIQNLSWKSRNGLVTS